MYRVRCPCDTMPVRTPWRTAIDKYLSVTIARETKNLSYCDGDATAGAVRIRSRWLGPGHLPEGLGIAQLAPSPSLMSVVVVQIRWRRSHSHCTTSSIVSDVLPTLSRRLRTLIKTCVATVTP